MYVYSLAAGTEAPSSLNASLSRTPRRYRIPSKPSVLMPTLAWMCVCMCVCACVCVCLDHVHVCMRANADLGLDVCVCVCVCVFINVCQS